MNVKQIFVSSVTLLSIGSLVACSRVTGQSSASTQTSQTVTTVAATIDWASLPTKEVTLSNDSVTITGGTIDVTAAGDGIKSNNDQDTTKGNVQIRGGIVTVEAGDDGIQAESSLSIDDGQVTVAKSIEGVEGANVTINGGTVDVTATDDGVNAASDVMGADIFIKVTGGKVKVSVGQGYTDAFDSNGDLAISGGSIEITAPTSAFDGDGTVSVTGGDVTVNGQTQTEIVATGPGAGGFGGEPGAGNRS